MQIEINYIYKFYLIQMIIGFINIGNSIEAHQRNYPYSKESTTTNAFKLTRERSVA